MRLFVVEFIVISSRCECVCVCLSRELYLLGKCATIASRGCRRERLLFSVIASRYVSRRPFFETELLLEWRLRMSREHISSTAAPGGSRRANVLCVVRFNAISSRGGLASVCGS